MMIIKLHMKLFIASDIHGSAKYLKMLLEVFEKEKADTVVSAEPVYDRNIREFIFLEDTTQQSDTVRMRIIER